MPANASELHAAAVETAEAALAWVKARKADKAATDAVLTLLHRYDDPPIGRELADPMRKAKAAHSDYSAALTRLEAAVQAWATVRPEPEAKP